MKKIIYFITAYWKKIVFFFFTLQIFLFFAHANKILFPITSKIRDNISFLQNVDAPNFSDTEDDENLTVRDSHLNIPENDYHIPKTARNAENRIMAEEFGGHYFDGQSSSNFYTVQNHITSNEFELMEKFSLIDLFGADNLKKSANAVVERNLKISSPDEQSLRTESSSHHSTVVPYEIPQVPKPKFSDILSFALTELESLSQTSSASATITTLPGARIMLKPDIIGSNLYIDKVWTENNKTLGLIKVEVEETLGHVADWLEVKTHYLRKLNGLRFGQVVHMGQALIIPLYRISKEKFEEKRFQYHKRMQENFFDIYQIESLQPYYIQKGESIWTLSNKKFNLPLWLIRQCNPAIDLHSLNLSQKLMIPVVEKKG